MTSLQRATDLLVASIVLLPLAAGLGAPRVNGAILPSVPLADAVWVLLALALFAVAIVLATEYRARLGRVERVPAAAVGAVVLIAWIAYRHLAASEVEQFRNVVGELVIAIAIVAVALCGASVLTPARWAFRFALVVSLAVWLASPAQYVNQGMDFVDSGKLIATLPSVQGVLGHPNYTGLYFAAGIAVEVAHWGRGRLLVSVVCSTGMATVVIFSQARNAILAAIAAAVVVLLIRSGRLRSARLALTAVLIGSLLPLAFMIPSFLTGRPPSFEAISVLGTRSALWEGVAATIPDSPIFGSGRGGIERARSLATDTDVIEVTHAHNQVLHLILVGGCLALVIYLFTIVSAIRSLSGTSGGAAGLLTVVLWSTVSETPFVDYIPLAGVVVFLLMVGALTESDSQPERNAGLAAGVSRPATGVPI